MDYIERMCREAEIVKPGQAYNGTTEYRCTQAQLALLASLLESRVSSLFFGGPGNSGEIRSDGAA